MAGLSTYARNAIRDHFFRTATLAKPAELWISLHIGDTGAAGGDEVTEGWYGRVQLDPLDANWDDPALGVASNLAEIIFGNPTGQAGALIVTHVGAWDAAVAGNFIIGGELTDPKTINNGDDAPKFEVGELTAAFAA
jgi:hypothetical protein